jgi:hypothetical protein
MRLIPITDANGQLRASDRLARAEPVHPKRCPQRRADDGAQRVGRFAARGRSGDRGRGGCGTGESSSALLECAQHNGLQGCGPLAHHPLTRLNVFMQLVRPISGVGPSVEPSA